MTPVDVQQIESFLREVGLTPRRSMDPLASWRLDVPYPAGGPHTVTILNPKKMPHAVLVLMAAKVSPEHRASFDELEQDERIEFNFDLRELLNREFVEFQLQDGNSMDSCPSGLQVSVLRIADGLSMDSLMRSVASIFKAHLAGLLFIQRRLNPKAPRIGGEFAFKKTSIQ